MSHKDLITSLFSATKKIFLLIIFVFDAPFLQPTRPKMIALRKGQTFSYLYAVFKDAQIVDFML